MSRSVFRFDDPDRFVAGTVGQPGGRTFFLQARSGDRMVSVALEKMQVSLLAEHLERLLEELVRSGVEVPVQIAADDLDLGPLDIPVEEEFRVGPIALGWDADSMRVVIEAQALTGTDEAPTEPLSDAEEGADAVVVQLPPAQARAFVLRAGRVVAAGRPPCPLCGEPLDPDGHICPRQNGGTDGPGQRWPGAALRSRPRSHPGAAPALCPERAATT